MVSYVSVFIVRLSLRSRVEGVLVHLCMINVSNACTIAEQFFFCNLRGLLLLTYKGFRGV
jgi:hypothetical protein